MEEEEIIQEEENQSEQPLDMEEEEQTPQEPIIIETKGKWQPFEAMTQQTLEVGKTYHIELAGVCEVAVSVDRPTNGIKTNVIDYKKDDVNKLWIKTGGI